MFVMLYNTSLDKKLILNTFEEHVVPLPSEIQFVNVGQNVVKWHIYH